MQLEEMWRNSVILVSGAMPLRKMATTNFCILKGFVKMDSFNKMFVILAILSMGFIEGALGQLEYSSHYSFSAYNCDKYCHASCGDYIGTSEFSICVGSNVHCNCMVKISGRNPLFLFFIVAVVLFAIVLCAICHRTFNGPVNEADGRRRGPHHIVAQPIIGSPNRIGATTANNGRPFIIPLCISGAGGSPQKSRDLPPEYLPPPPYNECVIDVDQLPTNQANHHDNPAFVPEPEEVERPASSNKNLA